MFPDVIESLAGRKRPLVTGRQPGTARDSKPQGNKKESRGRI
jgi:hypothetical protein